MKSQLVINLLLVTAANATQVANLNVSAAVAAQYGCNTQCYKAFSAGLAADYAEYGSLYDENFYETAHNFSGSAPGDILKLQPIDPSQLSGTVPTGITAYRFQYTSVDISNNTVPVTGFIAFPYADRKNGHLYRTVAWAHGTSGVFKGCAPSAISDLYEYNSWSYLTERGYAVVATDYAGLGNNYTAHPYSALSAHANDVFYSVAAARKVFNSSLTTDWMSVGHSEGGGTVWSLAVSSLVRDKSSIAGNYLGTVAQAPGVYQGQQALAALGLEDTSTSSSNSSSSGTLEELAWGLIGFQNTFPNETLNWLGADYLKRLQLARKAQACYDSIEALATGLDIEQVVDLSNETTAMQALGVIGVIDELTGLGDTESFQPVLVVQGLADESVLPEVVEYAYNTTCAVGSDVHLQLYPGIEHDAVIPTSAPSFLQWMDDRFDGLAARRGCFRETVRPFNAMYLYAPPDYD